MADRRSTFACRGFRRLLPSRRDALRAGGAGMLGLRLPELIRAQELVSQWKVRARSVIFLYQFGGPRHVDTSDMQPEAPGGVRSLYRPIATKLPGTFVCEHMPKVAEVMDRIALVRSVHHTMKNHNPASCYALT